MYHKNIIFSHNFQMAEVQMTCRLGSYIQAMAVCTGAWSLLCFKCWKTLIKSFYCISTYMRLQSTEWITWFHTDIPLNLWFLSGFAPLIQTLTYFFNVYNFERRLAAHGFSSFSYAVQFHQSPPRGLLWGSTRTKAHGSNPQTRKYLSYIGYCLHCLCLLPQNHLG